ncbi:hypothetical protein ACQCVB_20155 [Fictibacillus phosphorivorans]|uniref:hypothetical protein n=1 Tax=Fictibacillus phosphorivorans TaxID=1221500 RepID=UPI003CF54D6F
MKVQTRVTAQGTEYWDAKEKRVRFVPTGEKPDFEVTEDPKSMVMGVDVAKGTDQTVVNEINLDEMDADQLLKFAKDNNIDVPGNMKKEDTIRNHISEELNADTE